MDGYSLNKVVRFILLLLLAVTLARAEDIYVAATAAGGDDGTSCANAKSATWFNTAGSWGVGAAKISAGDTVHLCGTFGSALTVQASGTSGNRITILFESGANFTSAASWGTAINLQSFNYLTVDGGVNGFIRNTNNGTSLGSQNGSSGAVSGTPSVGEITIRNLTITNMFVNTPGGVSSSIGSAIGVIGVVTNILINNNRITHQQNGVFVGYSAGSSGGVEIYSNICSEVNWGVGVGSGGAGAIMVGISVHHNTATGMSRWDSSDNGFWHHNGVYLYADQTSARMTNVSVYANTYGPDLGTNGVDGTAGIFMSSSDGSGIQAPLIYNNVIYVKSPSAIPAPGAIFLWGTLNAQMFNNTIDGGNVSNKGISLKKTTNAVAYNNIVANLTQPVFLDDAGVGVTSSHDNNCYFHNSLGGGNYGAGVFGGGSPVSWPTWKGFGQDLNSVTNDPVFLDYSGGNFRIGATSSAIAGALELNSYFTTDADSVTRGSVWDIGAFEYIAPSVTVGAITLGQGTTLGAGMTIR